VYGHALNGPPYSHFLWTGRVAALTIRSMTEPTELIQFPAEFDDELAMGPEPASKAFFGRNVLRGLVEGIDDFIRQPRSARSFGPVLLGSAMSIGDEELLDKIGELYAACLVIPKKTGAAGVGGNVERLSALNERMRGVPIAAFWELSEHAPKVAGQPQVVGPDDRMDFVIPTFRTIGYRRLTGWNPVIHAKLALLGDFWWHDEHPSGVSMEYVGYTPRRLWVSSANFTRASRRNLEFGYWTENSELMEGVRRFLVRLIAYSEPLDPSAADLDPELASVEYDDMAMAEAMAEMPWDEGEDV
jgi:hypothetical protein